MENLRPSYRLLKFTKRIEVHGNHKHDAAKTTYADVAPFCQVLLHMYITHCIPTT